MLDASSQVSPANDKTVTAPLSFCTISVTLKECIDAHDQDSGLCSCVFCLSAPTVELLSASAFISEEEVDAGGVVVAR